MNQFIQSLSLADVSFTILVITCLGYLFTTGVVRVAKNSPYNDRLVVVVFLYVVLVTLSILVPLYLFAVNLRLFGF